MKISRLAYECVRHSISTPDNAMTYENFIDGEYPKEDYSEQIEGVYDSLNRAFARLHDLGKVGLKVVAVEKTSDIPNDAKEYLTEDGELHIDEGEIVNIVDKLTGDFSNYSFRSVDNGHTAYVDDAIPGKLYVEYRPDIPQFDENYVSDKGDVELRDLGVSDSACRAVEEFVKADLMEYLAPDMSIIHSNRAEAYFEALPYAQSSFYQRRVKDLYGGTFHA